MKFHGERDILLLRPTEASLARLRMVASPSNEPDFPTFAAKDAPARPAAGNPRRAEGDFDRDLVNAEVRVASMPAVERLALLPRLYATPGLHRLFPDGLALALAAAAARAAWWARPDFRERARSHVAEILAAYDRQDEVEGLARRFLVEKALRGEMLWRPWMWDRTPVLGFEHLRRAQQDGRGVLLALPHLGFYLGIAYPLLARGVRLTLTGGDWYGATSGHTAYRARSRAREIERRGGRIIRVGGTFVILRGLLERGEVCHVAADLPGSGQTTFLGRPARLATGVARLSLLTRSPVVLAVAAWSHRRPVVRLRPPLWPCDFATPEELLERLAGDMTEEILARPASLSEALTPNGHLRDRFALALKTPG